MYWLIIPALIGIGKLIFDSFKKEQKAYEDWQEKRVELEKLINERSNLIKQNLQRTQSSYDFHNLTNIHYFSFKTADMAYKLLHDEISIKEGIDKMINKSLSEKRKIEKTLSNNSQKQKDLKEINELINELRKNKNSVGDQSRRFKTKLYELNLQTRELKLLIKEECGQQGYDWYVRLEERKRRR